MCKLQLGYININYLFKFSNGSENRACLEYIGFIRTDQTEFIVSRRPKRQRYISLAKSIQFQVVNVLKCISNALDGTTTQHKAPCLVHNIQINVSTSFGAFGKRFIEDIATISWYASLFPCYLQHYFTQQLEKWETQSDIHWKRKKQTNPMIYRFPLPLLELIYSITVEIGWYFHVTWKK